MNLTIKKKVKINSTINNLQIKWMACIISLTIQGKNPELLGTCCHKAYNLITFSCLLSPTFFPLLFLSGFSAGLDKQCDNIAFFSEYKNYATHSPMAGVQDTASNTDMSQAVVCKNSCSRFFPDGSLGTAIINSNDGKKYVI